MTHITKWFGLDGYTVGDALEDGTAIVALSLFTATVFIWSALLF